MDKDVFDIGNQYIPCVEWSKISFPHKYIRLYAYEPYEKMSFRNRCVVAGSNGLVNLSVPLVNGRDQKRPFRELRIANQEPWQRQHWRTLVSCYGNSPFWEFYCDAFARFYEHTYTFLFDLNVGIITQLMSYMNKKQQLIIDESPWQAGRLLEGWQWLPKNFQKVPDPLKYPQLFEDRIGFQPNLSSIDLLCMCGPDSGYILASPSAHTPLL